MKKILIYGAGKTGEIFIKFAIQKGTYEILGVMDKNPVKHGTYIGGGKYRIFPLSDLSRFDYDEIVIAIAEYDDAITYILNYTHSIDKISVFDCKSSNVFALKEQYDGYLGRQLLKKQAVLQIQNGLLMECMMNNEFSGFKRVLLSCAEYLKLVKDFFCIAAPGIIVKQLQMDDLITKTDKIIVCDKDYIDTISQIRKKNLNDNQWVLIPLFDVINSIHIRK